MSAPATYTLTIIGGTPPPTIGDGMGTDMEEEPGSKLAVTGPGDITVRSTFPTVTVRAYEDDVE